MSGLPGVAIIPLFASVGWVVSPSGLTLSEPASVQAFGEAIIALTLALVTILGLTLTRQGPKGKVKERSPGLWVCGRCGMANEIALGACWNCHLAKELQGLTPTHIPEGNRWRCPHCSVWNGILRTGCWHCGLQREGPPPVPADMK
jgi:hypothetical protein